MNIAILGSNSMIAMDIYKMFVQYTSYDVFMFARYPSLNKSKHDIDFLDYARFQDFDYGLIINFIGAGDQNKLILEKNNIISTSIKYDQMVMNYLVKNSKTKYIYISSGSVYLSDFKEPAKENDSIKICKSDLINEEKNYQYSKIIPELVHLAERDLNIINLRIFNYVSNSININQSFLVSQIFKSIINKKNFECNDVNIFRDFISDIELFDIINLVNDSDFINDSFDCFSKKPISLHELLDLMKQLYNLNYNFSNYEIINQTGIKLNYFSNSHDLLKIGYKPKRTSAEIITSVAKEIIN